MTRIAGDSRTYAHRLCRHVKLHDGDPCPTCTKPLGRYQEVPGDAAGPYLRMLAPRKTVDHRFVIATEYGEDWISISTVAHILDKGGALSGWAFNVAVAGVVKLVASGIDVVSMSEDMLKAALKQAGATPWVKKNRAASRGTEVHEALERIARGDTMDSVTEFIANIEIDDFTDEEVREVQNYAVAAVKWYVDKKPRALLIEQPVWSATHRTAGTLDLLAERPDLSSSLGFSGVPTVLTDLKTAKDVYTDHPIQLDGYDVCLREMVEHGVIDVPLPEAHSIVLAKPDGTYDEHIVPSDRDGFLHALGLSRAAMRIETELKARKDAAEAAQKGDA